MTDSLGQHLSEALIKSAQRVFLEPTEEISNTNTLTVVVKQEDSIKTTVVQRGIDGTVTFTETKNRK